MNTINELTGFCKSENPIGCMMLTGEWGCGKTYLIENNLQDALGEDFVVVRVSLFGIDSTEGLHDAVKKAWMLECGPISSEKLKKVENNWGLKQTLTSVFTAINLLAAFSMNGLISVNAMDLIAIEPWIDDLKTHKKKKVVLVFDDLERSRMDLVELLGSINEYSENRHFNTIIVANEEYYILEMENELTLYNLLKEKIIAYTVLNDPDFGAIIHTILSEKKWQSEEYKDFLNANEELILGVFKSEPDESVKTDGITKPHNIRTLEIALENFYRIYVLLKEASVPDIGRYLYSFIAFTLTSRSGIKKKGRQTFDFGDAEIKTLYPRYSEDAIGESIIKWVKTGDWDEELFRSEIGAAKPDQTV